MTSLQRVRNAVAGLPIDHLPAQPMLMMFAAKHSGIPYIEYTRDGQKMAEAQLRAMEDFDLDVLLTCSDPAREVIDIAGEGSVEWLVDQGPAINEDRAALANKARLNTFRIPDPLGGGRMHDRIRAIEIMRARTRGEVSIVGWVEGPLALAAELRGINAIMIDFLDDPPFVHDLLDFCVETAKRYADAQVAAGADTIGMSDAAASLMGPELYRQFLQPRQEQVFGHIKRSQPGVLTRSHMCGQTDSLIGQMAKLSVDIYELDFPVHLPKAREALGPDRIISGNVSTITDMLEGTPEKVYEAARRCHAIAGSRHIVNCGCEVSPLTPAENLRALVRYAKDHKPSDVPA